jgi:hypothetical protein
MLGGFIMTYRSSIGLVLAAALTVTAGSGRAADEAKYPDWKGQWTRFTVPLKTQPSHDQTKPWGFGQAGSAISRPRWAAPPACRT